jgi:ElaB/YqjD/DUF883 family membrane-anchored ribosome-binding protein
MPDTVHKPGDSSPPDPSSAANPQQPHTPSTAPYWNQNALNQTAERIGTVIGTAVNVLRGVQRQLRSMPNNVVSIRERVRERSQELGHDASDAAREWRQNAQVRVKQARERTAKYMHDNPFQVIAAVAGVAFCTGVALRIWRSRLD